MRAVIFDLDGTLVDSAPDIHASANALLKTLDLEPLSLELVRSFIGNGIPKLVERVMKAADIDFTEKRHEELTAAFIKIYDKNPVDKTTLYPGVRDILDLLQSRGYAMGVCTNKAYDLTVQVLKGVKIDKYFTAVVGGDSLPTNKPDPAMLKDCIKRLNATSVVYVGDSEIDSATAAGAAVPFVLFTNGYRKRPVSEIAHRTRFSTFSDLPGFMSVIGESSLAL